MSLTELCVSGEVSQGFPISVYEEAVNYLTIVSGLPRIASLSLELLTGLLNTASL